MKQKIYPEDVVLKLIEHPCLIDENGKIWSKKLKERAIYENCTHTKCKTCGERDSEYKGGDCWNCRSKKNREKYMALPTTDEFPICDDDNRFFWSEDELQDYLEENKIEESDMFLYAAEQKSFMELSEDYWSDEMNEEGGLPNRLQSLIDEFNKKLKDMPGLYWMNEKKRYSSLK